MKTVVASFLVLTVSLFISTTSGATFTWASNTQGGFGVGTNWVGGVAPGPGDTAVISDSLASVTLTIANTQITNLVLTAGTLVPTGPCSAGSDPRLIVTGNFTWDADASIVGTDPDCSIELRNSPGSSFTGSATTSLDTATLRLSSSTMTSISTGTLSIDSATLVLEDDSLFDLSSGADFIMNAGGEIEADRTSSFLLQDSPTLEFASADLDLAGASVGTGPVVLRSTGASTSTMTVDECFAPVLPVRLFSGCNTAGVAAALTTGDFSTASATWVAGGDRRSWSDPDNWSPVAVPPTGAVVDITGATQCVSFDVASANLQSIDGDGACLLIDSSAASLTLAGAGSFGGNMRLERLEVFLGSSVTVRGALAAETVVITGSSTLQIETPNFGSSIDSEVCLMEVDSSTLDVDTALDVTLELRVIGLASSIAGSGTLTVGDGAGTRAVLDGVPDLSISSLVDASEEWVYGSDFTITGTSNEVSIGADSLPGNGILCSQCLVQGEGCDDGDPCTLNDVCNSGLDCVGSLKSCDDGNPCTFDFCRSTDGACTASPECYGLGECSDTGCSCNPGQCSQFCLVEDCNADNGACIDGTCTCERGWTGDSCEDVDESSFPLATVGAIGGGAVLIGLFLWRLAVVRSLDGGDDEDDEDKAGDEDDEESTALAIALSMEDGGDAFGGDTDDEDDGGKDDDDDDGDHKGRPASKSIDALESGGTGLDFSDE